MLGIKLNPRAFMERAAQEMLRIDPSEIQTLADDIWECYQKGRFVFVIGNGGSGSNSSHFAEDMGKCTLCREDYDNDKKKRLRILSLTDNTPYILAWANDEGFERVFVEQLKNLASPGDLLVAISGSGNSPNILRAVEWANRHDLKTFGCTGYSGGKLRTLAQKGLHVPLDDMGLVESIHLTAFHWVVGDLHRRIAGMQTMFLGIEIGGTKLQVGVGAGDGVLAGLWRGAVDVAAGPDGIRKQIAAAVPELLATSDIDRATLRGVGIGFGGPVDDSTQTIIKSHQIDGWDGFPLGDWISDLIGLPAALGNDADVAGLAEALHGAGKGLSPIFYITVGSGIGGGLVIDGQIYRGVGRGAAEIGHLVMACTENEPILEEVSSGWAIEKSAAYYKSIRNTVALGSKDHLTVKHVVAAAEAGDTHAEHVLEAAISCLAEAICHVIALLCPRRIVIGGGVSLIGDKFLFKPLRKKVKSWVFKPFAGLTDIVPAAMGEAVVVHGALALARQRLAR